MVLSTWKKSTLDRPGTASQFGSRDFNRVSDLLNGEDVGPVEIGTDWHFERPPSGLEIPGGYIFDGHINGSAGIAYSKLALADCITDNDIFAHTSTKISIANRAQLPPELMYIDRPNRQMTDPTVKRSGWAMPTTASIRKEGILADHTNGTAGTISNLWDAGAMPVGISGTEGLVSQIPTTAATGVQAGLVSPTGGVGITRRAQATLARARVRLDSTSSARLFFGFTSLTTMPIAANPLGNADHGVIVGHNTSDEYLTARINDGTGAADTAAVGNIPKDALYHTYQIDWNPSGDVRVSIDGNEETLEQKLPGEQTNLYFNCVVQTNSTTARSLFVKGIWLEVS